MKKRVLSALLALCLTLSLAGAAFAENETPVTTASPAPVTQDLDENNGEPAEMNENGEDQENTELTDETLDDATYGAEDSDSIGVPEEDNTFEEDNSTSADEGDSVSAEDTATEDDSTSAEDENTSTPADVDDGASNVDNIESNTENDATDSEGTAPTVGDANRVVAYANMPRSIFQPDPTGDSDFTLTWERRISGNLRNKTDVQVILWDSEANQAISVEGNLDSYNATLGNPDAWTFSENTLPSIEGYTYQNSVTYSSQDFTKELTSGGLWVEYDSNLMARAWKFYDSTSGKNNKIAEGNLILHVNYIPTTVTPDPDPGVDSDYKIEDTVRSNGYFTVLQSDGDVLPEGYTVQWYRAFPQDESNQYPQDGWSEAISRVRVHKDMYNLSADKESLNVTLDAKLAGVQDALRLWYKAVVLDENGQTVSTLYKRVPYYIELQNGGFETPVRSNGQYNVDLTPDSQGNVNDEGVIWKTTDTNHQIEIIRPYGQKETDDTWWGGTETTYTGTYGTHGVNAAPEEGQIAELNAESEGTLYQDVLTVPETTLHWQLQHRARNYAAGGFYSGYDTMYVIIMSADKANDINSQDEVRDIISMAQYQNGVCFDVDEYVTQEGLVEGEVSTGEYAGTKVWRITDYIDGENAKPGKDSWTRYLDDYEVPAGQYMTRFFFAAGRTGFDEKYKNSENPPAKRYTVGNLLDDVQFTPDELEPNPGNAMVKVTKTVSGLTDEELRNYSVTFNITDNSGGELGRIVIDSFGEPDANGNSTADGSAKINMAGAADSMQVIVSETLPTVAGSYDIQTVSTSGSVTGEKSITVTLQDQQTTNVAYTNTYTATTADLSITKTFTGLTKEQAEAAWGNITFTAKTSTGTSVGVSEKEETLTENGSKYVGKATISGLTVGETYTITENGALVNDYNLKTTATGVEGEQEVTAAVAPHASICISQTGNEVTFENSYSRQTGTLTVTKNIQIQDDSTADVSAFKDQKFVFTVKGVPTDTYTKDIEQTVTVKVDDNGEGTADVENLPVGIYTVTETQHPQAVGDFEYESNDGPKNVSVSAAGGTVAITNQYKHKDKTLTIQKTVIGNMANEEDQFQFTLALTKNSQPYEFEQNSIPDGLSEAEDADGKKVYTFNLTASDESNHLEILLPYGVTAQVTETPTEEYTEMCRKYATNTTAGSFTAGNVLTAEMDCDTTFEFQNKKEMVNAPTGLSRNNTPYAVMIGVAILVSLALVGGAVVRRRRRWME